MTKLYRDLVTSRSDPRGAGAQQGSDTKDFINEASKQGFGLNVADFFRFAKMAEGRDMGSVVRELRESGDINEDQFQDLRQKAIGFLNLIKMVGGK